MLPLVAGPLLWARWDGPVHVYVWTAFVALRIWETFDSHCGWELPWPVRWPLSDVRRHDYHHSANKGNYGGCTLFWDVVLGTDAWAYAQAKKQ